MSWAISKTNARLWKIAALTAVTATAAVGLASSASAAATLEVTRGESEIGTAAVVFESGREAGHFLFAKETPERQRGQRGRLPSYIKARISMRTGRTYLGAGCGRSIREAEEHVEDASNAGTRVASMRDTYWCALRVPTRTRRAQDVDWLKVTGSTDPDVILTSLPADMSTMIEGGRGADIISTEAVVSSEGNTNDSANVTGDSSDLVCAGTLDPVRGVSRDIMTGVNCRGPLERIESGDPSIRLQATFDMIRGGGGNDHIMGTDNDDSLSGGPGNDLVEGGRGNDLLLGYAGNDTLNGGSGDDELDYNRLLVPPSQRRVRFPGDSADPQSDIIAGNDNLNGGDGEDTVGARFLTTPITATSRTLIAANSNDLVNSVETFQLGQSDDTFSGPIAGRITRVFGNEGNDRIDVTGNGHPAHGDSVDCGEGQDRVEIDFPRPGAEHVSHDPDIADGTSECESSNYLDFLNAVSARR